MVRPARGTTSGPARAGAVMARAVTPDRSGSPRRARETGRTEGGLLHPSLPLLPLRHAGRAEQQESSSCRNRLPLREIMQQVGARGTGSVEWERFCLLKSSLMPFESEKFPVQTAAFLVGLKRQRELLGW